MKKINVVLDTDVASSVDDRFSLVYAFLCKNLSVKAITLEPFSQNGLELDEAILDSKFETNRLLAYLGVKSKNMVFEGSSAFFKDYDGAKVMAVEKIKALAQKYDDLVIVCTGVLTNIAILLKNYPELSTRIKVVWLGLGNLMKEQFDDANYLGDRLAFEAVATGGVNLVVLPDFVADRFSGSYYELSHVMSGSLIGDYLLKQIKDGQSGGSGNVDFPALSPVVYLSSPETFLSKQIPVQEVLKHGSKGSAKGQVEFVYEVKNPQKFWSDFINKINGVGFDLFTPKTFFVSDTHFTQIRKIRMKQVPYRTLDESDRELVLKWNRVVWKNDIVYHLGDFGNYQKIKELNGKVTLICGNYEAEDIKKKFDGNFDKFRKFLLDLGFAEVYEKGIYLDEAVLGERVYLTHKPTDHDKTCFTLFGHVHTLAPVKRFGFNVCISYHNYTPISASKIKRYIDFVKNHSDRDVFV